MKTEQKVWSANVAIVQAEMSEAWTQVRMAEYGGKGILPAGGPVHKMSPSNAGGADLIPGWGAKIPYASHPNSPKPQKTKQKQYCNIQ